MHGIVALHPRNTTQKEKNKLSMQGFVRAAVVCCGLLAATHLLSYAQTPDPNSSATSAESPAPVQPPAPIMNTDQGRVGAGVKVSLYGIGGEVAVRVTHHTNVRAGFNAISYSRNFDKDGISYAGQLNFKTFEAHYDYFPWAKSFHISPGVLVYAADPITATASAPAGSHFTLGGVDYYSSAADPITGTGKIKFNQAAPTVTVGWGNLVSRKEGKHFTVPFEVGVAFQGSPKASLSLAGTACDSTGTFCQNAATDPTIQSNIVSEQTKVNNSMSFFKVYPIISIGFGYKF